MVVSVVQSMLSALAGQINTLPSGSGLGAGLGVGLGGASAPTGVSGGLAFVSLPSAPVLSGGAEAGGTTSDGAATSPSQILPLGSSGVDTAGFMRVFVVDGGINMPELGLGTQGESDRNNANP